MSLFLFFVYGERDCQKLIKVPALSICPYAFSLASQNCAVYDHMYMFWINPLKLLTRYPCAGITKTVCVVCSLKTIMNCI